MNIARQKALATLNEGRKRYPYLDTATPPRITIGVGRNLTDVGLFEDEIDLLLWNDLQRSERDLRALFPWVAGLDEVRLAVMIDLTLNLGIAGLAKFKRTLTAVRDGRYGDAADHLTDSVWYGQVKTRGVRMVAMMRTGRWWDA